MEVWKVKEKGSMEDGSIPGGRVKYK